MNVKSWLSREGLARFIPLVCCLIIVLLPFFAIITVWPASVLGHYTLIRLWPEWLILVIGLITIGLLFKEPKTFKLIISHKLVWAIGAYVIIEFVSVILAIINHNVSPKALAYGVLDDIRFFVFFFVCWLAAIYYQGLSNIWWKLIIWPAAIVILFGLAQMSVLPINFLVHFGYGPKTILPYETINSNIHYVRILSTLRGANPLGAYLIIPLSALATLIIIKPKKQLLIKCLLLVAGLLVLYGSYSRAAWVGAILAIVIVIISRFDLISIYKQYSRWIIGTSIVLIMLVTIGGVTLDHSHRFQNIIFHTQTNSKTPVSSDRAHLSALVNGLKYLSAHPLGTGPGSSGPASFYNHYRPVRITENYFLQVGEESGWLGLGLFVMINLLLGYELWLRRNHPLALVLLAALIGITFVNFLSLAWTDDTLSFLYWGLAGLAMSLSCNEAVGKTIKKRVNYKHHEPQATKHARKSA